MMVAGMAPGVVAVAALFPAPAAADLTQGFDVFNLSSHPIKLLNVTNSDKLQGGPPDGAVLNPGAGTHHFEKIFYVFDVNTTEGQYGILGDDGQPISSAYFNADMTISAGNVPLAGCQTYLAGVCTPPSLAENQRNIVLYDDPGTVLDIPAARVQAQAEALRNFCDETNTATCAFTASSEQQVDSPTHQVGNALINNTDEQQETTVTVADTVGSTDSVEVGLKVGGKLAELLDVEISAKYAHEWTQEHTFSQDVRVFCPAHHKCWINAVAPMYRDTGNFTVTLGNTTWNLQGVYFDSPDPTRGGAYSVEECLVGDPGCTMQADTLSDWPPTVSTSALSAQRRPKVLSGTYEVPHDLSVRGIFKPKLHHVIAGPSSVTPGGEAGYRISLSRRQFSDRFGYAVKDVRVRSTVAGRPGRRWTLSTLHPFQPRKLKLNTLVPRTARGRYCVSVRAVAKHARGAKARHCATVIR
jgi:hypothetical protein